MPKTLGIVTYLAVGRRCAALGYLTMRKPSEGPVSTFKTYGAATHGQ